MSPLRFAALLSLLLAVLPAGAEDVQGTGAVYDGYRWPDQAGYDFSAGKTINWSDPEADILGAVEEPGGRVAFFLPGLREGNPGSIGQAGIVQVPGRTCPEDGYEAGWFRPMTNTVYCVRSRNGSEYYRILLFDVGWDFLWFSWQLPDE